MVVAVVVIDMRSTQPLRRPDNPFAFELGKYALVDSSLITHREVRNIKVSGSKPIGIAFSQGNILLLQASSIEIITPQGVRINRIPLTDTPTCFAVGADGRLAIGFGNYIALLDTQGNTLYRSAASGSSESLYTSVAIGPNAIAVADAGARRVRIYSHVLDSLGVFAGESGVSDVHGLIIPSAHFTLAFNAEGELWVVNPGLHSLQNYTTDGRLRGHWRRASFEIDGFSGCCNPMYFAFHPNGSLVTSEKGLVRIKTHAISGQLLGVVAPPALFGGSSAPYLATDEEGRVYALDFDRKIIRIFEPIAHEPS